MNPVTEKIFKILDGKKAGVFCDDSNLYHAYKKYGWRVDFEKFRKFLEKCCDLQFINYYLAVPDKSDADYGNVQNFIQRISPFVTLKKKPLKYTPVGSRLVRKGDVDVEIVLDVVRIIDKLDVAIILSGDSDLLELKNYVVYDKKKNILFVSYEENMAWELRQCWHLYLNRIKDDVALK